MDRVEKEGKTGKWGKEKASKKDDILLHGGVGFEVQRRDGKQAVRRG